MSMFDAYQEEYDSKMGEVRRTLDELGAMDGKNSADKNAKVAEINRALDAMTSTVKQQELEARIMDKDSKKTSLETVSRNREVIANLRQELNTTVAKVDRSGLVGGRSGEDRSRMISANEKLANQAVTIDRLHRIVAETEQVGTEIIEGLGQNRQTIESIKGKTTEFGATVDDADTMLKRMTKRHWTWGFF